MSSAEVNEGQGQQAHRYRYLGHLIHIFVVVLMVSNLVGQKIVPVGRFRISGAQLLFPITYIFGDIFTEVYGYSASRRAIWTGFFASALLSIMGVIVTALPAAPEFGGQQAFETVFYQVPRMMIASLMAYWAGEFSNAYVLAKLKLWTKGQMLWVRTIGSTVVGQFVDTVVLMIIAFGGSLSRELIVTLIVSGYLGKVAYEALATPLTYLVVNTLKKKEGIDHYDAATNFNPFQGSRK